MTKRNILFLTLLSLFFITAIVTLLGILKVIAIDDFYLKGLFVAFLLELAATIFSIATKGNILEDTSTVVSNGSSRTTELKLHIWGDHRAPDKIEAENIFRWYYLQNILQSVAESGEMVRQYTNSTLFVSFEKDVAVATVKVRSPDMKLPLYEVKDFNQRYVIIVFSGHVNSGTLEIKVET